jgi:hypothetical protein
VLQTALQKRQRPLRKQYTPPTRLCAGPGVALLYEGDLALGLRWHVGSDHSYAEIFGYYMAVASQIWSICSSICSLDCVRRDAKTLLAVHTSAKSRLNRMHSLSCSTVSSVGQASAQAVQASRTGVAFVDTADRRVVHIKVC